MIYILNALDFGSIEKDKKFVLPRYQIHPKKVYDYIGHANKDRIEGWMIDSFIAPQTLHIKLTDEPNNIGEAHRTHIL